MNILIVGAGPTGLTAALECARHGITPEIVDAKEAPSPMSRAVGILPKSIDILNETGVGERLLEEGVKFERVHIKRGGRSLINLHIPKALDGKHFLIGLPQDRTESIMHDRLEEMGVTVRYNTQVNDIMTSEERATATFADGRSTTYDWIIGADGVHSTVREALNIKFEGYELSEDWSIADIELASGYEPTIRAWLLKGDGTERDAMVMIPMAKNRVRLVSSTPDSMKALPIELDVQHVRRSGTFKISVRQAKEYVKGRVLLAGDAAHAHSPVGGRGMNLGIEDAQAAVTAILNNSTAEYETKRKKKARGVINSTEAIRKTLVSNNPLTYVLLRTITWCVQHIPFMQKMFIKSVSTL